MNVQMLSRHIRILIRAEVLSAQAKLAFAMRRASLMALALVFVALAVVLLNMGLFAWLSPFWGPVWTPAGLGLINLALAGLAILVAGIMKPGPEAALAEELRNMAGESIEAELRSAPLLGTMAGGFDRAAMGSLVLPAITTIVGALAKRRAAKG